jgi:hypothetical protein
MGGQGSSEAPTATSVATMPSSVMPGIAGAATAIRAASPPALPPLPELPPLRMPEAAAGTATDSLKDLEAGANRVLGGLGAAVSGGEGALGGLAAAAAERAAALAAQEEVTVPTGAAAGAAAVAAAALVSLVAATVSGGNRAKVRRGCVAHGARRLVPLSRRGWRSSECDGTCTGCCGNRAGTRELPFGLLFRHCHRHTAAVHGAGPYMLACPTDCAAGTHHDIAPVVVDGWWRLVRGCASTLQCCCRGPGRSRLGKRGLFMVSRSGAAAVFHVYAGTSPDTQCACVRRS